MSTQMPEFEMPAAVDAPPRPAPAPTTTVRPAHTAEPGASDPLEPPRRTGGGWRGLLIAGIVGAIIGAAIPGGVQIAERAAAQADAESLRQVATDYLAAIAQGRAADATALVPLPERTEALPDAVLQAADPITDVEVRLVHIDGDAGTVEVAFTVEPLEVTHTLQAERVFGQWHLMTSLAEVVHFALPTTAPVTIGGAALPPGLPSLLYPGNYRIDSLEQGLLRVRAQPFVVDGDPVTLTEVWAETTLAGPVRAQSYEYAMLLLDECVAAGDCDVPPSAEPSVMGGYVTGGGSDGIDVGVQLSTGFGSSSVWYDAMLRIELDAEGEPARWLCAPLQSYEQPTEPCPGT